MRAISYSDYVDETDHSEFNHLVDKLLITSMDSIPNGLLRVLRDQSEWQACHVFGLIDAIRISYTVNLR